MRITTSRLAGLVVAGGLLSAAPAVAQKGYDPGYDPTTPGGAPTVTIKVVKSTIKQALKNGVKVKVTCNVACNANVRLYRGKKEFGTKSKSLPTGKGTIKVRLNAAARKQLRKGRGLVFSVAGTAVDSAGANSNVAVVSSKLKAPKKKKKH